MAKKIEEKYKELSEREHILLRPGMWVGSIKEEQKQMFIYDNDGGLFTYKEITYVPAMLKIVDEVISNSCDEYRRKENLGLNTLEVTIEKSGWITIKDNGGIPVVKHKDAGIYVPEFIFGRLRTSSNYDDSEDRNVIGTNGVGSALTNVFSKQFIIDTADKKKHFHRSWIDNMAVVGDDLKVEASDEHYTQTKFLIDFSRFEQEVSGITSDFVDIIEKRCIDAAAANLGLSVKFIYKDKDNSRKSTWKFKKFDEYINLYGDFIELEDGLKFEDKQKKVWVYPSNTSNINIGFVNGAECSKGTHFRAVRSEINTKIIEFLQKKHKIEIKSPIGIDNKYSMFMIIDVSNPSYSSQTKEELTTNSEAFSREYGYISTPDKFLNDITKSEIVSIVLDWYQQKLEAEDLAKIRKLNREAKKLMRSDKFINCTSKLNKDKQLWIFEGDSAHTGFRMARDPNTQASYRMRGVPLNTQHMTATQVMKNQVFNDIVNILGLQWGEYNHKENLKFNKIIVASDADYDGDKICALLFVFFNHFPELFEQKLICRVITPIISATKGKDHRLYYTREDYNKDEKKLNNFVIKYLKGVGTQTNEDYKLMMHDPILHYFTKDDMTDMMLQKWFGKGIASERKDMMKKDVEA